MKVDKGQKWVKNRNTAKKAIKKKAHDRIYKIFIKLHISD